MSTCAWGAGRVRGVDEEDLLLEAVVGLELPGGDIVVAQLVQQAVAVLAHGAIGVEERDLLVEGLSVVDDRDAGMWMTPLRRKMGEEVDGARYPPAVWVSWRPSLG